MPILSNCLRAMYENLRCQRLLKDSEIEQAIRTGLITIDDPSFYLEQQRTNLIQPASMDLLLRGIDDTFAITGVTGPNLDYPIHPDLDNSFVTFWPGLQTETSVRHLKWHNGDILCACPELRSTLRRVGLDMGFSPYGIGFLEPVFVFE